jgi:predicted regulator of Ras-like GTPase activity (Roadblock/LC7/MglB family)
MDASQAIADLTEVSSQIRTVALFDRGGKVAASSLGDAKAADRFARAALDLLAAADELRPGGGGEALAQLEAETLDGSVFVVRDGDRLIAATAGPDPTVGLVFYDLKTCLRAAAEEKPARKKATRTRATTARKPAARRKSSDGGGSGSRGTRKPKGGDAA